MMIARWWACHVIWSRDLNQAILGIEILRLTENCASFSSANARPSNPRFVVMALKISSQFRSLWILPSSWHQPNHHRLPKKSHKCETYLYHEAVGTELDPTSPTPFKPSPDFPKIPEILTRKPSRKSFVIWRVRGCHMEDSRRISLVLRMQMEIWPKIAMQSPGTHLFDMVVLVLGALNHFTFNHGKWKPRKVNTSQLLMHQRKFSSFVPLSPNFTHHSLFQGSPISRMNETHRYSIPFHPLDRRKRIPSTHLLPNWRNGCWHPCEGSSVPESQAPCSQTRTHVSLKGGGPTWTVIGTC